MSRFLLAVCAALTIATPALAQRSSAHRADWKVMGQDAPGYGDHYGVARHLEHASDYSYDLNAYVHQNTKPNPQVAKTMADELGRNLEAAKKHLASMRKANANNKAALASIDKIEKHLTDAFAQHEDAHACCIDENFDKAKVMACCQDLSKAIDAAIAEHHQLMQSLSKHKPAAK